MSEGNGSYEGWAIVELMGHRRLAGMASQIEQYGVKMLRLDVPDGENYATQFYGGSSIYCLTPTTEDVARAVASRARPEPVHTWELPAPAAAGSKCCGSSPGHYSWCDEYDGQESERDER